MHPSAALAGAFIRKFTIIPTIRIAAAALAAAVIAISAPTTASAQGIDLTGQFRCIAQCAPGLQGQPTFVTQNGWNLNLLNEAGQPSRAWIDWSGHLWADNWQEGALFSADGMIIQFDRGTIWQRDLGEIPPPPPPPGRIRTPKNSRHAAVTVPAVPPRPLPVNTAYNTAYDGDWSVLIMTQSGGCDRAYRYGVRIANGDVLYDGGGPVDLQGHVAPNGIVQVSVSGAGQQAAGQGRLNRSMGSGTWHGEGSLGSCAGVWQAERRS
ncbi:MAG TPA: hypothetical protein VKW08_14500 [Xanthobacteraceae bacterium]|nr:hypothetical protein [Xanthobacteraceae bacterium]